MVMGARGVAQTAATIDTTSRTKVAAACVPSGAGAGGGQRDLRHASRGRRG
jgi:hypothetical protein